MEKMDYLIELVKRARHSEYTADVVEAENEIIAQDWYDNILAIAAAFQALERERNDYRNKFLDTEQRAEAAEAKLAELEKQEPYGWVNPSVDDTVSREYGWAGYTTPLFTRAAPAINLAELVPDEMVVEPFSRPIEAQKILEARAEGFNLCRIATLRKIKEAK